MQETPSGNKIKAECAYCAKGFVDLLTVILIRTPWVIIRRRVSLNEMTLDLHFEQSVKRRMSRGHMRYRHNLLKVYEYVTLSMKICGYFEWKPCGAGTFGK